MHTLNCYLATRDGQAVIVGGTPGGDHQPQCNIQLLTNLIDFGMDPQAAVEAPRWWSFPGTDPATLTGKWSYGWRQRCQKQRRVGSKPWGTGWYRVDLASMTGKSN